MSNCQRTTRKNRSLHPTAVFLSTLNALTLYLYSQEYLKEVSWVPYSFSYNKWPSLSNSFSILLLFADHTQCFRPISDATLTLDFSNRILINTLTNWSSDLKISFHESKCTLLRFCSSPQTTYRNNYTSNHQVELSPTDSHTNLGLVVSADLSWQKPLISSCAYRTLGLLRHTFNMTNSVHIRKLLYLSLVRSQLIYCSIIRHPYFTLGYSHARENPKIGNKPLLFWL